MLKKDREAMAEIIEKNLEDGYGVLTNIAKDIANYIAIDNPFFNKQEFMKLCGITD